MKCHFVICSAKPGMPCKCTVLCFVNKYLRMFDTNSDGKRFLGHGHGANVQHCCGIAGAVPDCKHCNRTIDPFAAVNLQRTKGRTTSTDISHFAVKHNFPAKCNNPVTDILYNIP